MNWLKSLVFVGFCSLICCSDGDEIEPIGKVQNCNLIIDSLACTTGIGDFNLFNNLCIIQDNDTTRIKFQDEEFLLNDMGQYGPLGQLGYTHFFLELDSQHLHLRIENRGISSFEWCDFFWSGI